MRDNVELLFILLPVIFALYYALFYYRRRICRLWSSNKTGALQRDPLLFWIYVALLLLSYIFVVIALIGPEVERQQLDKRKSADIAEQVDEIALFQDVSNSMLVRDVKGNKSRLERGKEISEELLDQLSGFSVSLTAFAGDAEKVAPSTMDLIYIKLLIRSENSSLVSVAGTNFVALFEEICRDYKKNGLKKKVHYIFLTDGEETFAEAKDDAKYKEALKELLLQISREGHRISFVGIGSTKGGPVPELQVVSRLATQSLEFMTKLTNGELLFDQEMTLQDITAALLRQTHIKEQKDTSTNNQEKPLPLAIFAAFFFLAFALLVPETSSQKGSHS